MEPLEQHLPEDEARRRLMKMMLAWGIVEPEKLLVTPTETCPCCGGSGRISIAMGQKDDV